VLSRVFLETAKFSVEHFAVLGGQTPDQETIDRANEEGIPLLMWLHSAYDLAGQAAAAGRVNPSE
jgi:hypothetical protein